MTRARDRSPALALIARARLFDLARTGGVPDGFADRCTGGQLRAMALWWADDQAPYTEWPWDEPTEDLPRRTPADVDPAGVTDLVRAAALLAAEIDRRLRARTRNLAG